MVDFATLVLSADTRQLKTAVADLQAVATAGAKTELQTEKTGTAILGMGAAANTAVAPVGRLRDANGRYIKAGTAASAAAAAAAKGFDAQGVAAVRASAAMTTMAGAASAVTSYLLPMAAAALGIGAITREIATFDTSMSAVAAVTRATGAELEALRDVAKDLGDTTEFSAAQAADGLKFLGMAGFSARDAIAAIPDVLNLATAAQMDLASAADISSNIISGFGIATENAGDVADVLAAASSRANTDVSQLGQAMSTVAPISATLGISLEDTAAAIGVMSDAGIQGERAGTAMRGMLASLAGPTKAASDTLKQMGLTIRDVDPATNDLADILDKLRGSGMTASQAMTIFGREAASGALVLVDGAARVRDFGDELNTVEGEAQRMADTMRDNLGGDLQGLGSAISGLVIGMGEAGLTGAMRSSIQGATELTRWLSGNLTPAIDAAKFAFQGAGVVVTALAFTQVPALTTSMYTFVVGGGAATLALGTFTTAANIARAATIALGGPLGLVWGLIGAGAAAWLVFGDNAATADGAMQEAEKATAALNAALGTFYATAAPSAGKAAIDLANDNYKLAHSARDAARAELEKRRAMLTSAYEEQLSGAPRGPAGEALADNRSQAALRELNEAQARLDAANERLNEAYSARDRVARAVTSSATSNRMGSHPENLGLTVDLTLPDFDVPDLETDSGGGRGASKAAAKLTDAQKAAEAARDSIKALRQEHTDLAATIGMTAEQERIYHAVQELGTGATAAQVAEVQRLIPEIDRLKEAKDRMAQAAQAGKQALENLFGSVIDGSASAKDAVLQLLAQIAKVQMMNGLMKMPGIGNVAGTIGNLLTPAAPSFAGGGYTGNGARSGGIDGQGGFPAILHPRETVVDHTKGGGMGGGTTNVHVTVGIDESGNLNVRSIAKQEASSMAAAQAQALPGQVQRVQAKPRRRT